MITCTLVGLASWTSLLAAPQFEIIDIGTFGTGPCEPPCDADLNGDGMVGTDDLLAVLAGWTQ